MPFTRIEAVNRILRAGGGSPVHSLGSGSDSSNLAEASLVSAVKTIQVETQLFNTVNTTKTPDVNGKIAIDAAVIAIDGRPRLRKDATSVAAPVPNNGINVGAASGSSNTATADMNVTLRGGFLYDLDDDTDSFSKPVLVVVTTEFDYEACPSHVQEYAIAIAAREYQMEHQGDELADQHLARKEEGARQTYNRLETMQADANLFTDRPTNTILLARRGH